MFLLPIFFSCVASALSPQSYVIPRGQVNGTSTTDWTWWYFDAVSATADAAVVVQFYPGLTAEDNVILFNAAWPNGTTYAVNIPVGDAELTTIGDGSQGNVDSGAMTWFGSSDLSTVRVRVNLPDAAISGTLLLQSSAPPHVPCGPKINGASYHLTPTLAWGNPIPDSIATADFNVLGTRLSFTGSGYHDQNWGPVSYGTNTTEWYWGHAHVGEYSIVWFYHLDRMQRVSSSGYIAKSGHIVVSGCSNIRVQPVSHGVAIPLALNNTITGWDIRVNDGRHRYAFEIRDLRQMERAGGYGRWMGWVTGGGAGEANMTGPAIAELM